MLYYLTQIAVRLFLHIVFRLRIYQINGVPAKGGVLICSNHISNWDPVIVAACLKRPVSFMAKEELFRSKLLGPLIRKLHAFPIRRGAADHAAIKMAVDILKKGNVLVMFPEGTRKNKGTLVTIERGVGLLALRSSVMIVPANIQSNYRLFGKLSVTFGEPFQLSETIVGGDALKSQSQDQSKRMSVDEAAEYIAMRMRELAKEGTRF